MKEIIIAFFCIPVLLFCGLIKLVVKIFEDLFGITEARERAAVLENKLSDIQDKLDLMNK